MKLVILITNKGKSEQIIKACTEYKLIEAVTLLGKGTATSQILDALLLLETDKDVVIALTEDSRVSQIFKFLEEEFDFTKKGYGVGFSVSLNSISAMTFSKINELLQSSEKLSEMINKGDENLGK